MECRSTEKRQWIVQNYNVEPVVHIQLLAGQTKHSDAGATIEKDYYIFEAVHKVNGKKEVIQCGMDILLYTTVTYFLCGFMDLFPGALRGMGRSGVPMILSVIGTVGTRIVWIFWIFPSHRSLDILFISYPASWIITIILQVICYYFVRKQLYGRQAVQA